MLDLRDLLESPISSVEKGMPAVSGLRLKEIGAAGWNVLRQDVSFPVAVIREDAMISNAKMMATLAETFDLWLYPHGKTTMAPQIFDLQLQNGCRGITAANPIHAEICVNFLVRQHSDPGGHAISPVGAPAAPSARTSPRGRSRGRNRGRRPRSRSRTAGWWRRRSRSR